MRIKKKIYTQGSALLSALFIMTLVAIAATAMSTRLQLDIYRTHLTILSDKLYLASQVPAFWAMDLLSQKDKHFFISASDGKLIDFPKKLQGLYPDVAIRGSLYDLQARFNVNNLQDKKFLPLLLKLLDSKLSMKDSKTLVNAIRHWITPYQPEKGQDQFLQFYSQQKPAYLPGFQPMKSISELRLVAGVNAKIYKNLLPDLIALPETTAININTASKSVLAALGNGLDNAQVSELMQARGEEGITELNDVAILLKKLDVPVDQVTLESSYFLCVATAMSEDITLTNYTIIKRSKDKQGEISTSIVYESLNTL